MLGEYAKSLINNLSKWSSWQVILLYFIICLLVSLIFFKVFHVLVKNLHNKRTLQSANDQLFLCKIFAFITLAIMFSLGLVLLKCFTILVPSMIIMLIFCLFLFYIRSAIKLLDYIISLIFTYDLVKDKNYICVIGEVVRDKNSFYLDYIFSDEPIFLYKLQRTR